MRLVIIILLLISILVVGGCSFDLGKRTCEQLDGTELHVTFDCPEGTFGIRTKDVCKSCTCCIPLKYCERYYDGCNTCKIEGGRILSCTERGCLTYEKPRCLEYKWPY